MVGSCFTVGDGLIGASVGFVEAGTALGELSGVGIAVASGSFDAETIGVVAILFTTIVFVTLFQSPALISILFFASDKV